MADTSSSGVAGIIGTGLLAQRERLSLIASNLANANSVAGPGGQPYRALEPVFVAAPTGASAMAVTVAGVVQSTAPPRMQYDPGSPLANRAGYVAGSNVEPVQQMVDLIDATQNYQAQIAVLSQSERLDQTIIQSFIA